MTALLSMESVSAGRGPTDVLRDVSMVIPKGSSICVLGPNGAGKTTMLRCISGLIRPRAGRIVLSDSDISHRQPWEIAAAGVSHVPEGRRCFGSLTVAENLRMGAYVKPKRAPARMEQILDVFPQLQVKLKARAETLSGGQQQMLAIARGLMAEPNLLLLDEPSQGLAPVVVAELAELLVRIRTTLGIAVMLVEQNAGLALATCERAYVLHAGRMIVSDRPVPELTVDEVVSTYMAGDRA